MNILYCDLVSVIMPAYNSEKYIAEAIESLIGQTYEHWELIVVDDCSKDTTVEIIKKYQESDNRIRLINLSQNGGPAVARNRALKEARGRYLAFLDSDDVWFKEKLSKQISFMKENSYVFTFHDYYYLKEDENNRLVYVEVPKSIDYEEFLKGNSTGSCLTTCIDSQVVKDIFMPDQKHEDYICWLDIFRKNSIKGYGINEALGYYRIGKESVSSNKFKSVYWTWKVYRDSQKLNIFKSFYYMYFYIIRAIKKRV